MAKVTAEQIKQLKDMCGADMKQCKAALEETRGKVEPALSLLIERGVVSLKDLDPEKVSAEAFGLAQYKESMGAMEKLFGKGGPRQPGDASPDIADMFKQVQGLMGQMAKASAEYDKQEAKLHGKVINDPVFGKLRWEHLWEGTLATQCFGKKVRVIVGADGGAPPTDEQRRAMSEFLKNEEQIHKLIEQANFDYYNEIAPNYRQDMSAREWKKIVPEGAEPKDLWRLLTDTSFHVPDLEAEEIEGWEVRVAWNCTWEEEHGHEVWIRNGKVEYVGIIGG